MTTTGEGAQLCPSAPNGAPGSSDFPQLRFWPTGTRRYCCNPRLKAVVCQLETGTDGMDPAPLPETAF